MSKYMGGVFEVFAAA